MNENTGFAAFALYNALKLHFTSDSYDYFKYNGKTNVSKQTFSTRKDKYHFYKLSRKYDIEQLKDFYVANFVSGNDKWVGSMLQDGEENYTKWTKTQQSLTYTVENDIIYMSDKHHPLDWIYPRNGNDYPMLLKEMMQGSITLETVVILVDMMELMPMWSERIKEDIIWPSYKLIIKKYTPFVHYDKNKFRNILRENIKENA